MEFEKYAPNVAALIDGTGLAWLSAPQPNRSCHAALRKLTPETLAVPGDPQMAHAAIAGLWLYHGFLDEAHAISQEIDTPVGSYWHALVHRLEPDYGNSKYWFRRVGRFPTFEPLHQEVRALVAGKELPGAARFLATQSEWDPYRFVDLMENAATDTGSLRDLCLQVQTLEWTKLFDYCWSPALRR